MPSPRSPRLSHHHGNLRSALVEAALAHVRAEGASTFSLRHATNGAGVTSAAAYRHFGSRAELLDEIVVLGFTMLARSMRESVGASRGPARLRATGRAYVQFAHEEPHLFALMFGPDGAAGRERAAQTDLGVPSGSAQLRDALSDCGSESETTYVHAWALAHGLAALAAVGTWEGDQIDEVLKDFASSL